MNKFIVITFLSFLLSNCAFVHKMDIEQGNVITLQKVRRLHPGMSEMEVKNIMGDPLEQTLFAPNRLEYVYTMQKGHEKMQEKRITCLFAGGTLVKVVDHQ